MDPGYSSALAALTGSVIGGLMSLAASWISQSVQARSQQRTRDISIRQELYTSFIGEASKLYAEALTTDKAEINTLVGLYAMTSHMRILSTRQVVEAAHEVVTIIADTYFEANRTLSELRATSTRMDLLGGFSEACRDDLRS